MPGHHYTQSEYALQKAVESCGNVLFELDEQHLIHTYRVVLCFTPLDGIDYLLVRNLSTRLLPFEEYCEKWLFDGEVCSSLTLVTDFGESLIWKLFSLVKRLSLRIR